MSRFQLKNKIKPVSYTQFMDLSRQFYMHAADAFDTTCAIDFSAYSDYQFWQGCYDPSVVEWEREQNESLIFQKSNNAFGRDTFPEYAFKKAKEINIRINPINKVNAPPAAMARIEFKKHSPRSLEFYIQPMDIIDIRSALIPKRDHNRGVIRRFHPIAWIRKHIV